MPEPQPDLPPPVPAPADDRREKMTISEAAAYCHVDYNTFHRWLMKGVIPYIVVGGPGSKMKRVYRRDVQTLMRDVPCGS